MIIWRSIYFILFSVQLILIQCLARQVIAGVRTGVLSDGAPEVMPEVVSEVLAEPRPSAFNPGSLGLEDFDVEVSKNPLFVHGSVRWVPGSIQWARVRDVLTLPRAQFALQMSGVRAGNLIYPDGKILPLNSTQLTSGQVVAPLQLCSGPSCAVKFEFKTAEGEGSVFIGAKFSPRKENLASEARVLLDPSCSPWKVHLSQLQEKSSLTWAMVGCKLIHHKGEDSRVGILEARVFLDSVGVEAPPVLAASPLSSYQVYRLSPQSGTFEIPLQRGLLSITYDLPQVDHWGHLGLGFGPYLHQFNGYGDVRNQIAFLLNVDASYQFDPKLTLSAFGFTVGTDTLFTDLGLYAKIENFRELDRRFGFHLLIGGQAVFFKTQSGPNFFFAFPQGFEMEYLDFLQKGKNLTAGGFIYPPVNSYSYYNFWIRWGGAYFIEIDSVFWHISGKDGEVSSSSVGFSVGAPVLDFL